MRVALSSYRSKPHSGGQGVYVRNLSRELVALGHEVEVFSGPPYPDLDEGVLLTRVPSLDLYREPDPFRIPRLREFRTRWDVLEYAIMCTAGFPEPRTFSYRLAEIMRTRAAEFDVLHDNQTLGPGLLTIAAGGLPVLTTVHHPISADRRVEIAAARGRRRITVRRWYGFVQMQRRVAARSSHLLTVSERAKLDITADFGVAPDRIDVVPVGVDTTTFTPASWSRPGPRVPGRVVAITSADVPMKGLDLLLQALAKLPTTRTVDDGPGEGAPADTELIVVGRASDRTTELIGRLGLTGRVRFVRGLPEAELAALLGSAQLLVVPSLYEGFSLPAVEAMACATPVLASSVGALPELLAAGPAASALTLGARAEAVTGTGGVLVPPGDVPALATALADLLGRWEHCARLGEQAHARVRENYSWAAVARATSERYERLVAERRRPGHTVDLTTAVATAPGDAARSGGTALPSSADALPEDAVRGGLPR